MEAVTQTPSASHGGEAWRAPWTHGCRTWHYSCCRYPAGITDPPQSLLISRYGDSASMIWQVWLAGCSTSTHPCCVRVDSWACFVVAGLAVACLRLLHGMHIVRRELAIDLSAGLHPVRWGQTCFTACSRLAQWNLGWMGPSLVGCQSESGTRGRKRQWKG